MYGISKIGFYHENKTVHKKLNILLHIIIIIFKFALINHLLMKDTHLLLHPGGEAVIPLPQKPGYRIVSIKIRRDKKTGAILSFIPVYKKDRKTAKYPLTDFYLN